MFPNLKDKVFTDITTNESVIVIDQLEDIATLDNQQKISVRRLLDTNFYDQKIDPSSFFSQQNYQVFADKIKSIPNEALESMKDDSIVIDYDPEEERRLLEEKARKIYGNSNNQAIQDQNEKFKDLIDEDDVPVKEKEESNLDVVAAGYAAMNHPIAPLYAPIQEDPMKIMFKNIKKNTDLKITLDIFDKIPRPDFIEMMEDSYEVSLIDYLSDEFTKKILENPNFIKDKIKKEINNIVYGKKKELKKPTPPLTKMLREGENLKISRPKIKILNEWTGVRTDASNQPTPQIDRSIKEGKVSAKPISSPKN